MGDVDYWIEVFRERKREIDDLFLVLQRSPSLELGAEMSKKIAENNALLNSLEKQESIITTHEQDVSTLSPIEDQEYEGNIDEGFSHDILEGREKSFDKHIDEEHNFNGDQVYEGYMDEEEDHEPIKEEREDQDRVLSKCLDDDNNQVFVLPSHEDDDMMHCNPYQNLEPYDPCYP
jgi:hypothetical protein